MKNVESRQTPNTGPCAPYKEKHRKKLEELLKSY